MHPYFTFDSDLNNAKCKFFFSFLVCAAPAFNGKLCCFLFLISLNVEHFFSSPCYLPRAELSLSDLQDYYWLLKLEQAVGVSTPPLLLAFSKNSFVIELLFSIPAFLPLYFAKSRLNSPSDTLFFVKCLALAALDYGVANLSLKAPFFLSPPLLYFFDLFDAVSFKYDGIFYSSTEKRVFLLKVDLNSS